jgi:hypothetical protein
VAVGVVQVMLMRDTTKVNIALPRARRAPHFSYGDRLRVAQAQRLRLISSH